MFHSPNNQSSRRSSGAGNIPKRTPGVALTSHRGAGFLALPIGIIWLLAVATAQPPVSVSTERSALESLNGLIGEWRGAGQLRRGSNAGAWQETAQFIWDFSEAAPSIRYDVTDGRLLRGGRLRFDAQAREFVAEWTDANGALRVCRGDWSERRLVLLEPPQAGAPQARLTFTPLNDKRALVLFEAASVPGATFQRVGEIGYTRAGTSLAEGSGGRECIVTGGAATIAVMHQGQTYYVCCSGCAQAFQENPEGILAEYQQRMKERRRAASPDSN